MGRRYFQALDGSRGVDMNTKETIYGWTPLAISSAMDNWAVVNLLIVAGAAPSIVDDRGFDVLHTRKGTSVPEHTPIASMSSLRYQPWQMLIQVSYIEDAFGQLMRRINTNAAAPDLDPNLEPLGASMPFEGAVELITDVYSSLSLSKRPQSYRSIRRPSIVRTGKGEFGLFYRHAN